jgi:hypothetical protein
MDRECREDVGKQVRSENTVIGCQDVLCGYVIFEGN